MTDDLPPPSKIPPAAQSPYPPHPAPKAHGEAPLPQPRATPAPAAKQPAVPGFGALGVTLLGGALAAAVGAVLVRPLLRRDKAKPTVKNRRKSAKGVTDKATSGKRASDKTRSGKKS